MRRFGLLLFLLLIFTGCQTEQQANQPLPTVARLPSAYRLEDAERIALNFLDAWRSQDIDAMYGLTSAASQEATPFAEFSALYRITSEEMTLASLTYQPSSSLREADEVAVLSYDILFQTRLLGDFSDGGREMRLVVDTGVQDWRVDSCRYFPGDDRRRAPAL
jgi:hypothetical protein